MKILGLVLAAVSEAKVAKRSVVQDFAQVGLNVTSLGNWNNDFFETEFKFEVPKDLSLEAGWEVCWDNPYPPGRNDEEHAMAKSNEGLKLEGGSLHWVAGTHRCFKGSDSLNSNNSKFTIPARHYILSKCGYFNNYYIRSGSDIVTIKATEKLNADSIETDLDKISNSFVTSFQVRVN